MDEMNFSYGIIAIVGVLAAISIGFIAMDPTDVMEPRVIAPGEKPVACTMQWDPMCGVDGVTYGNSCMLNAADAQLNYPGECAIQEISVHSDIMPGTATVGDVLLIEVEFTDDDGNIVDHVNYDIFATQDGDAILSEPGSHRHPGKHPIHETAILSESQIEIKVIIQGLGHGDMITGPAGIETAMTVTPESATEEPAMAMPLPVPSGTPDAEEMVVVEEPATAESVSLAIVSIPPGVAVPGCEKTGECYLPSAITIFVGQKVSWSNADSAAHTVTSGTATGTTGVFDSGIFMSGSVYEFTFDDAGTYDYFCMVHPWMTGKVLVR
ncbi:MAG: hypothetical protein E4G77_04590 [Nitrosopumilus sp.]|nr:MAG: hypothetical protein E4G77_04590 [Nitrosopumilus sp.]